MTRETDILQIAPRHVSDDEPLTVSTTIQFDVPFEAPLDPTSGQFERLIETSGALDFWLSHEEDIYGSEDGTPV